LLRIDEIIAEEFSSPDLELVWLSEEDNDLGKNEATLESRQSLDSKLINRFICWGTADGEVFGTAAMFSRRIEPL
jgi:hypothetical protein